MADLNQPKQQPQPQPSPPPWPPEAADPPKPKESPVFRWLLPAALRRGNSPKAALLLRAALLWGLIALGATGWLILSPIKGIIPDSYKYQAAALILILTLGLLLNYALETWRLRKAVPAPPPPSAPSMPKKSAQSQSQSQPNAGNGNDPAPAAAPGRRAGPAAKKNNRGGRPRRRK